ncbi:single-stranded DNA-binding protein [Candidatus Pacearchaeota archaeon]|nr:single-stranded DNA-binding protein [Candidatus Pacearchaeota archaeon]
MSVNKSILVGRLGKDPEVRYGKDGGAICNFSLATSEKWKGKDGQKQEKTSWHRIAIFGKLGEVAAKYLNKGSQIYIEGRLDYGEYEKEGVIIPTTRIIASHMTMLGQAGGGSDGQSSDGSGQF